MKQRCRYFNLVSLSTHINVMLANAKHRILLGEHIPTDR